MKPSYIVKKLFYLLITFFIIITVSFFLMRFSPGSPFTSEKALSEETIKYQMAKYGYDKPILIQYGLYLKNIVQGNLGPSLSYKGKTVTGIIGEAVPYSLGLGIIALMIAYCTGVVISMICVIKKDTWIDYCLLFLALIGICIPGFLLAKIALFILGYVLKIAPTAGYEGFSSLLLPGIILSLPYVAYITRMGRKSFADEYRKDYIRTAHASGIPERRILFTQVLKNGFLPLLTFMGPAAAALMTGTVVIEKVFALPGLGKYFVYGALNRDHFLVMGVVMLYSSMLLIFNFIVDIMYHVIDPRISLEDKGGRK
jgi:oligopeptide transport system permease protein